MDVIIDKKKLQDALTLAKRSTDRRSTLAILGNIHIEWGDSKVAVTGNNLSSAVKYRTNGAETKTSDKVTLPADLLIGLISTMPNGKVQLDYNAKAQSMRVKGGEIAATIKGMSAYDFPIFPQPEGSMQKLQMPKDDLAGIFSKVAYCASTDQSRTNLLCVHFTIQGERLLAEAIDGYRMARLRKDAPGQPDVSVLLRASEIGTVLAAAKESDHDTVDVWLGTNSTIFDFGGADDDQRIAVAVTPVESQFPAAEQIVPKTVAASAKVDAEAMLTALRPIMLFSDRNNISQMLMTMVIDGEDDEHPDAHIRLESQDAVIGSGVVRVPAEIDVAKPGDEYTATLNARFVQETMSRLTGDVIIGLNDWRKPIRVVSAADAGLDYVNVIMPMQPKGRP